MPNHTAIIRLLSRIFKQAVVSQVVFGYGVASVFCSVFTGFASEIASNKLAHTEAENELNLAAMIQPLPDTAKFTGPGYNVWCGTMVRDDEGKCHLFYSRWPDKLGHQAWVTDSEVAHAIADNPLDHTSRWMAGSKSWRHWSGRKRGWKTDNQHCCFAQAPMMSRASIPLTYIFH